MTRLYSTREAAAYKGLSVPQFEYQRRVKRAIIPDGRMGRAHYYRRETLDAFTPRWDRTGHRGHPRALPAGMYSVRQAAYYLGYTYNTLRTYVGTGRIVPDGKAGGLLWFRRATLDAFKRRSTQ